MLHTADLAGDMPGTTELLQCRSRVVDMEGRVDMGTASQLGLEKQVWGSEQERRRRIARIMAPMCRRPARFCNRLR